MSQVETLDISPVGRVEGDLDVRVDIQDGVVVDAWTSAELFRGLEIILRDKDPQAGLIVTPRACGICGASHLTCAAWALDTAWQTYLPPNAILTRNLGQLTESLQSLIRHHYALFIVDLTHDNYRHSAFHQQAVELYTPFSGKHYEAGVGISAKPVEMYALFGGQWPHSSYMVPGGVMCTPTLTDITRARALLEYIRTNWIEPVWLGCSLERYEQIRSYDDFMAWLDESPAHANSDLGFMWRMGLDIGLDKFGRGIGRYMSNGYLPDEHKYQHPSIVGRSDALRMPGGIYLGDSDTHLAMDQSYIREDITHAWYEEPGKPPHPYERLTNPVEDNTTDFNGKYSWCTSVLHEQQGHLETGPLARNLVYGGTHMRDDQYRDPLVVDMYRQMGGSSVLLRQFARMHDLKSTYRQIEHCLEAIELDEPFYEKPHEQDGQGWGATEASRGALSHWIEVEAGKIKNYQIISPTTWNISPRDANGVRGPIEEALIGTPIADRNDPVEVAQVARSYDSCMVCTVHAHDASSGEELARFRTA